MTDEDKGHVVGTILVKCERGKEKWLRDEIRAARGGATLLCLLDANGASATKHEAEPPACGEVEIIDAAYCFGPFDFLLVIRAADAGLIEHFVVECLRSDSRIKDTQTLVGIAIEPKSK
jgi:Lrp/AsnC ligand binding domain